MEIKPFLCVFIICSVIINIFVPFPVLASYYTYDVLNRLTQVTYDNGTIVKYTYDAMGNRLSQEIKVFDTTPPEIIITSPEAITYLNTAGLLPITYAVSDLCDKNPQAKAYLDGQEYSEATIDLGKYLGETDHVLKIIATDASGNESEKSAAFTISPEPLKSFSVKDMTVKWQFPKGKNKGGNPIFTLSGQFELPASYQKASLDKSAFLSLLISGKLGKEQLSFKEIGNIWLFQNKSSLNQGINIKSALIYWWPDKNLCGKDKKCANELKNKNWFYIRGELTNGADIKVLPREAGITFEFPLSPSGQKGSLIGQYKEKFSRFGDFWKFNSLLRWNYWKTDWWKGWDNFSW